jgi:hypothetical protein
MNMNLEHDLQQALRRKQPPDGFGDRVLERIASGTPAQAALPRWNWRPFALPIAASVAILIGGGFYVSQRDPQGRAPESMPYAEGEHAVRQVVLALAIASEKLSEAQIRVQEIAHHEPEIAH